MMGPCLTVPITSRKKKAFVAAAKRQGLTVSALVRLLVDDFLAGNIIVSARSSSREADISLIDIQRSIEDHFYKTFRV